MGKRALIGVVLSLQKTMPTQLLIRLKPVVFQFAHALNQ
jgi:hypothetical protein